MQLKLSLAGLDHGPHLEEIFATKLEHQIEKLVSNYDNFMITVHVDKNKDGLHTVTAHADLPGHGGRIAAKNSHTDLVVATKKVSDQLQKQILRFQDR